MRRKRGFWVAHFWPIVFGVVGAIVAAVGTGLPVALLDGLQVGDLWALFGTGVSAGLAYLGVVFNRYGGRGESWLQGASGGRKRKPKR